MTAESGQRNRGERDALRKRVQSKGEQLISDLEDISLEAKQMREVTVEGKTTKPDVSALRLRADINLALLKKILPDLKAMEVTGADGEDLGLRISVFTGDKARAQQAQERKDSPE